MFVIHSLPSKLLKPRSHRTNEAVAFLERWKKVHHRSLSFNKRWPPLRNRCIRSDTANGPAYRSDSFELHKILRAVRKGQFSAPAKFTAALTTLSQSLASLDANSWTIVSARPKQKSWMLGHRCFAGDDSTLHNLWWAVVSVSPTL